MEDSKTLKTIQTFSKVFKVFCKIGFIFSIIGAVGCLIGLIGVAPVNAGCATLAGIVYGIVSAVTEVELESSIEIGSAISAGIAMIFISFILKYGAEKLEN